MHEGHRKRMLQRLIENSDSMNDHELLEVLLFCVIPRKNTNEIAHQLLSAFGSIREVLAANYDELLEIGGVGSETAAFLVILGICYDQLHFDFEDFPKQFTYEWVSEYLGKRYCGLADEVLEIYFFDSSERLKYGKRFTSSSGKHVKVSMAEITSLIVKFRPHALLLAHNHPSGNCTPSAADDDFTKKVCLICNMHNVMLYDHVIVGRDGIYSYFRSLALDKIRKECNVERIFKEKN